ncbi:hypothetical protein, partial [Aquimarina longa]|uniref:hypothetical protein n=1 Tax=Aquimarina longa TaxID=1080221 RepID=UPI000B1F0EC1
INATTQIQYVLDVAYVSSIGSDYNCRLNRQQFFSNGKQSKRLVDVLAEKCMNAIYPIHFLVTPFGEMKSIVNFVEVKQRWETSLKKLNVAYKGEFATQYFDQINQNLQNEGTFLESLKNDSLFSIFFFKIVALYEKNQIKNNVTYSFPVVPYQALSNFIGTQKITSDDKGMYINFKGEEEKKGILEITHCIDKEDFTIQKARASYRQKDNEEAIIYKITKLTERQKKYKEKIEAKEEIPKELVKKKKWFPLFKKKNLI